jgi:hypothetical protein
MIPDHKVIGQEDETAQKQIVDHEHEKNVPNIMPHLGQLDQRDLSGGKGHDQNEGRQQELFQKGCIASEDESKKEGGKKHKVAIFQVARQKGKHFLNVTPLGRQFQEEIVKHPSPFMRPEERGGRLQ